MSYLLFFSQKSFYEIGFISVYILDYFVNEFHY